MEDTIARFIYPRLKAFKEMKRLGIPCSCNIIALPDGTNKDDLKAINKWEKELDSMIESFYLLSHSDVSGNRIWAKADKSRKDRLGDEECYDRLRATSR